MTKAKPDSQRPFTAVFPEQGLLTISFKENVSVLSVHLNNTNNEKGYIQLGTVTEIDLAKIDDNHRLPEIARAFYHSMHALVTNTNNPRLISTPNEILGKALTIWTPPLPPAALGAPVNPESISLLCRPDRTLHLSVTGKDDETGQRRTVQHMLHEFPSPRHCAGPRDAVTNQEKFIARCIFLLDEYGVPLAYTP